MSPLIPIVVGGVLTLAGGAGTEWLRDRRVHRGAREDRRETRQEHRDDLQRETMIDLQDALQRFMRATAAIVHFDEMTKRERGTQTMVPDGMSDEFYAAEVLTMKLSTRVRDGEVRGWVRQMIDEGKAAVMPHCEQPFEHLKEAGRLLELTQERLGAYIRSL
jgi:hypothetical protein